MPLLIRYESSGVLTVVISKRKSSDLKPPSKRILAQNLTIKKHTAISVSTTITATTVGPKPPMLAI
jgi:hypothetical protein